MKPFTESELEHMVLHLARKSRQIMSPWKSLRIRI